MEILFLANRFPYPPYRGDKLKIYNLAKRLSKNHNLHLITFVEEEKERDYLSELQPFFKTINLILLPKWQSYLNCLRGLFSSIPFQVLYFKSNKMQKLLDTKIPIIKPDAVHIQHLRMAQYKIDSSYYQILDMPDAFSLYWERRLKTKRVWWQVLFDKIESKRVNKYEEKLVEYPKCLVCSQEDLEHLEKKHKVNNLGLLPNGVDTALFGKHTTDYTIEQKILFTGNMNYAPNVDGVIYFVKEILPIIKRDFPKVIFTIAGQRPVASVLELEREGVVVTGFVEDLAAVYMENTVVVAPLRFGAGTQNKVLEAMVSGIPVVCTEIGFKGLGIESGEGAIMTSNKEEFAQEVIGLLNSKERRIQIGEKGRAVIKEKFSWEGLAKKLEGFLMHNPIT